MYSECEGPGIGTRILISDYTLSDEGPDLTEIHVLGWVISTAL